MRIRHRLITLGALLALGCSEPTAPAPLDGTWRQDLTVAGSSLEFTLSTRGDAVLARVSGQGRRAARAS